MGPDRRDLPMNNSSSRGICNEQLDIKKKKMILYYMSKLLWPYYTDIYIAHAHNVPKLILRT